MKLSVSVPDALWRAVCQPGDSASAVVQRGLRRLAEPPSQSPFERAPASDVLRAEFDRGAIQQTLARLVNSATALRIAGYQAGLAAAGELSWEDFELLRDAELLVDECLDVHSDYSTDTVDRVRRLATDRGGLVYGYKSHHDAGTEALPHAFSREFMRGAADALLDVRDAVRMHLNDDTGAVIARPQEDTQE